jgi:TolB-like protein
VNSRINLARRALGDNGKSQKVIQTLERRGFRFVASVRVVQEAAVVPVHDKASKESRSSKPSIAVLPFRHFGRDPSREFVVDGLTEEVINALSKFRGWFVISPMTSFSYKGRLVEVSEAGSELRVDYIVEGSVRIVEEQIRVTAELTDTQQGVVLWSEVYDRPVTDMLTVQAGIARAIAGSVEPELNASEAHLAARLTEGNWRARAAYYRSLQHLYTFTEDGLQQAEQLLNDAAATAPGFAPSYARLGYVHIQRFWYGPHEERGERLQAALDNGRRAVALDDREAFGHFVLGRALALQAQYDQAIAELRLAVQLNPSLAQAHFGLGQALFYSGRAEEGLPHLDLAVQLSPRDPHLWTFHHVKALALLDLGRQDEAEQEGSRAIYCANATHWAYATVLAILGTRGKTREARPVAAQLHSLKPSYSCSFARLEFAGYVRGAFVDAYVAGLRAAGVGP